MSHLQTFLLKIHTVLLAMLIGLKGSNSMYRKTLLNQNQIYLISFILLLIFKCCLQVKKNVMTVHAHVAKYGQVVEEMAREIDYYKQVVQDLKKKCKCGVGKCDAGTETEVNLLRDY